MKKIVIILTIIFSLLLIGATYEDSSIKNFTSFEELVVENLEFVQNGVKVRYEVKESEIIEYRRLEKQLEENYSSITYKDGNRIKVENEAKSIEAIIWYEGGNTTVEISLINNQSSDSINGLKQEITKLLNNKVENVIYFTFVKGKIDNIEESNIKNSIDEIITNNKLEVLDISNGFAATGYLKSNERINLGYVGYDTGQYLIIGTPTIFVTY